MLKSPLGRLLAAFLVALGLVSVYLLAHTGQPSTVVRIIGLAILIVACGRAVLLLILGPTASAMRWDWGYVGIVFGGALVFYTAILLRGLGIYTFSTAIAALVIVGGLACAARRVRQRMPLRYASAPYVLCYLVCVFTLLVLLSPENYPFVRSSAVYLTQGFDLFLAKDPSAWPYFGEMFVMPMMYVTHVIGTFFALFSHGDSADYYTTGQYLVNILLAPIVPIGAFLFFRRFLPWWAAIAVALGFCASTLEWKVWSIRGETLGWCFGFAFLITLDNFLAQLKRNGTAGTALRLPFILAALYVAMSLTHGVSAMVTTFMAAVLCVHSLFERHNVTIAAALRPALCFVGFAGLLFGAYIAAFTEQPSLGKVMFNYDRVPVAGEPDAAHLIENALVYPFEYPVPPVHAAPPYIPASAVLQLTTFLPIAGIFRPRYAQVGLAGFPGEALSRVGAIPRIERAGYLLALAASALLMLCGRARGRSATLFWIALGSMVLLVLFSLYLNYVSISVFPLAASRRTYPYVAFFFALATGLGLLQLLSLLRRRLLLVSAWSLADGKLDAAKRVELPVFFALPAAVLLYSIMYYGDDQLSGLRPYMAIFFVLAIGLALIQLVLLLLPLLLRSLRALVSSWALAGRQLGAARRAEVPVFFALLVLVLLNSIAYYGRNRLSASWLLQNLNRRIASVMMPAAVGPRAHDAAATASAYQPLHEAINFVRGRTAPNEWVYSNIISDNQFWYLSDGRLSLLEGSAMYQVYDLQRRAAERLKQFAQFAATAQPPVLRQYAVRYVLLYKYCECRTPGCYGYNVASAKLRKFSRNRAFSLEFENSEFMVLQLRKAVADDAPTPAASSDDQFEDCYRAAPPYHATLADGVEFARPGMPAFMTAMRGLGLAESWGRWSVGDEVKLHFRDLLPTRFRLSLEVDAFEPSAGKPVIVLAGTTQREFVVIRNGQKVELDFDLPETVDTLTFKIPMPMAPYEIDPRRWTDKRRLGIGFIRLRIEPKDR